MSIWQVGLPLQILQKTRSIGHKMLLWLLHLEKTWWGRICKNSYLIAPVAQVNQAIHIFGVPLKTLTYPEAWQPAKAISDFWRRQIVRFAAISEECLEVRFQHDWLCLWYAMLFGLETASPCCQQLLESSRGHPTGVTVPPAAEFLYLLPINTVWKCSS